MRWWFRRRDTRPPKGTRPEIRMMYDGVIYDLTEELERLGDDEYGCAQWQVHGPQHLRLTLPPDIVIHGPIPHDTHLKLSLIGGPDGSRFPTREEIANGC